ncbi:hypothetical protein HCN44_000113 [Aphidius gifuensis]|uniref:Uncharacterized protein n=2 Tax=Aphidius gifuensis TaxID=684658 RepID=A0A834XPN6_APHGI|nr:hypothetical protein HCN44_000113 [Aphidius gifuensis]
MLRQLISWRVQHLSTNKNLKTLINISVNNYHQHTNQTCIIDEKKIYHSCRGELQGFIENMSLHEYVWKDVNKWWNKTAVICSATERSYTYGELRKLSGRFATSLRKLNIKSGESIAVVLPNIPEYIIILMGASEAGIPITFINPAYNSKEIAHQLVTSRAVVVVTVPDKYSNVADSIKEKSLIRYPMIVVEDGSGQAPAGTINLKDLVDDRVVEFEKTGEKIIIDAANDTVFLPFSSGTTGLPKAIQLTHQNIVSNLCQSNQTADTAKIEPALGDYQEIVPMMLPAYHIYALTNVITNALCHGVKLIAMPKPFTSNDLFDVFNKHKVTSFILVPPILQLMTYDKRFTKKHIGNNMKIGCGAATANTEVMTKFQDKFGDNNKFCQGYGMTETSPVISFGFKSSPWGSVGHLVAGTSARIVGTCGDNYQKNLDINECGEIVVKGPQVMKGYLNNPKATEEIMDGEWLKTGDLGRFDKDGNLWITGRLKELIKVKGFQVAPAELETILHEHEKILDVAVIGVPHERYGEIPKAFVVAKKNVQIKEDDIKNYVAERVVDYKQLGHVVFVNEIPKSPIGKILRKKLYEM